MVLTLPGRREVSPGAVCRGPPAAGWGVASGVVWTCVWRLRCGHEVVCGLIWDPHFTPLPSPLKTAEFSTCTLFRKLLVRMEQD